jgi:hypothetical protein
LGLGLVDGRLFDRPSQTPAGGGHQGVDSSVPFNDTSHAVVHGGVVINIHEQAFASTVGGAASASPNHQPASSVESIGASSPETS